MSLVISIPTTHYCKYIINFFILKFHFLDRSYSTLHTIYNMCIITLYVTITS